MKSLLRRSVFIVFILAVATQAGATIDLVDQSRHVSGSALSSSYDTVFLEASGFGPFEEEISVISYSFWNYGYGAGWATQDSDIQTGHFSIHGNATASAQGGDWFEPAYGEATASSYFEVLFEVLVPEPYSLTGSLDLASLRLDWNGTPLLEFIPDGNEESIVSEEGVLEPGTYTLTVTAEAWAVAYEGYYSDSKSFDLEFHLESGTWFESPEIIASVDTPGEALGVAVSGNHAYVAEKTAGLQVVDILTPEFPVVVGAVDTPGSAYGVAVSNNYAYVADFGHGLQVIDVSVPESPVIVATVLTPDSARGVAVSGNYAYVVTGGDNPTDGGSLQVIDISEPESPVTVGAEATPGAVYGVAVAGNYAYLADVTFGLQVIDISVPENPATVGAVNTPGGPYGLAVAGNYACLAAYSAGLQLIDISMPEVPVIVTAVETPAYARGVAIAGNYVFVAMGYFNAQEGKLRVIDISVPESPRLVGTLNTPSVAHSVVVSGDYAYVATGYGGLQVVLLHYDQTVGIDDTFLDPDPETVDTPRPLASMAIYPNPFNPRATVSFAIGRSQNVELAVFDLTGKRIAVLADRAFETGQHSLDWEGRDLQGNAVASGTYLLRMVSGEGVAVEKMMLIR